MKPPKPTDPYLKLSIPARFRHSLEWGKRNGLIGEPVRPLTPHEIEQLSRSSRDKKRRSMMQAQMEGWKAA